MADELFNDDAAFPRLGDEVIAALEASGRRRHIAVTDVDRQRSLHLVTGREAGS